MGSQHVDSLEQVEAMIAGQSAPLKGRTVQAGCVFFST